MNAMIVTMITEKPLLAKVLIVGASGVGKTTLVNSLIFEGFTEVTPTIGVNFAQKACQGEKGPINLSIWDLSGHPRFSCLMPRFCVGASGIVLVIDMTLRQSLEVAAQWLARLSSYLTSEDKYAVVLVGNKADLQPQIRLEEIQTFCRIHQLTKYISCSAKTGQNVKLVFTTLCSSIQKRSLHFRNVPKVLLKVHQSSSLF